MSLEYSSYNHQEIQITQAVKEGLEQRESVESQVKQDRCLEHARTIDFHLTHSPWFRSNADLSRKIKEMAGVAVEQQNMKGLENMVSILGNEKGFILSHLRNLAQFGAQEVSAIDVNFRLQKTFVNEIIKVQEQKFRESNQETDGQQLLQNAYLSFQTA